MRTLIALVALLVMGVSPASARHYHHAHYRHHSSRVHYARRSYDDRESLSEPCRQARSLGGPCGCFASELVFGHSVRNLWTAASWYEFPKTEPHPGAAAVRPHHVVLVVANNGDGTVTVHDSWGTHRQSTRGWTFVDPQGGHAPDIREASYHRSESRDYTERGYSSSRRYQKMGRAYRPRENYDGEVRAVSWGVADY